MSTTRIFPFVFALCVSTSLSAQQKMVAGDGWEAFRVEYQGGDSRLPKKRIGILVLRDDTIAFHECARSPCGQNLKRYGLFKPEPIITVRIADIQDVAASSDIRGPGTGSRLMWGAFAGDRKEETVGLAYRTNTSVESPVFKTVKAESAALAAKVRFRMDKLKAAKP